MAKSGICLIPKCDKKIFARGLCSGHWHRWRHHGDPLSGGTAAGEPLRYYHDVIFPYEGDECLFWPFAKTSAGYANMSMNGKNVLVSRVVCEASNGEAPTPKHEAAHSCGNGHLGCVAKRHLSWKTAVANAADRHIHGTQKRSELTCQQVREIRALRGELSQQKTAALYGITQTVVSRIQLRQTWAWLD